ncbi:hypothetical protein [Marinobacterium sediminicola]|uniref:Uncharacterized protein n=1 Tax=Marinobacterium sediminicola TaxID=518898 RepID=A0ABY1RXU9_9GAMM|nr:hypothetical protein [Marinobacterium sediminicola]ULG67756.1 hypothetical protein LN244_08455 [Marinobacterium sediminicola]SMR71597.1 hypothetical protein SAMN04487964_102223 [Marinobacterium sediminicola]
MLFRISNRYYRRQTASHLLWMLGLIVAIIASFHYLLQASKVVDFLLPVLGVSACSAYFIKLFQHLRAGRQGYPEIHLDMEARQLAIKEGDTRVEIDISRILHLKLDYRFSQVERIQITTDEGQVLRLEGYEEMAEMVRALESLTPESKISRSRLRIR